MSYPPMIHTVNINRRSKSGTNDFGEPNYTYASILTAEKVRIEDYNPEIKYRATGQDPEDKTIMYVKPSVQLQSMDQIIAVSVPGFSDGDIIGRVKNVVPAYKGNSNKINHYEAMLEGVVGNGI